jgi:hypothetical protein
VVEDIGGLPLGETEAAEAARRRILVTALIDEGKIPLEFRAAR